MPDSTPEDTLKSALRKGLVVKISGELPFQSDHPHHFVVLNYDPTTDSILIVTHATHQFQQECEKAHEQGEDVVTTVVYISPGTYGFFPRPTAFNCNEVKELTFEQMVQALEDGFLTIPPNDILSVEDVDKLVAGVLASSQTTPQIAGLLVPEPED